jgi:hypothetical protein
MDSIDILKRWTGSTGFDGYFVFRFSEETGKKLNRERASGQNQRNLNLFQLSDRFFFPDLAASDFREADWVSALSSGKC